MTLTHITESKTLIISINVKKRERSLTQEKAKDIREKNTGLEFHVGLEAVDGFWREVFEQRKVLQTFEGTAKTAVVDDGLGLIKVDVGVSLQLIECQFVEVNAMRSGVADDEVGNGLCREILYLTQLFCADITTESLAVADDAAGKSGADARHLTQLHGVGGVEVDALRLFHLHGIFQRVTNAWLCLAEECGGRC